jgi:hypothetical protein
MRIQFMLLAILILLLAGCRPVPATFTPVLPEITVTQSPSATVLPKASQTPVPATITPLPQTVTPSSPDESPWDMSSRSGM